MEHSHPDTLDARGAFGREHPRCCTLCGRPCGDREATALHVSAAAAGTLRVHDPLCAPCGDDLSDDAFRMAFAAGEVAA